jgi:hypothetical protein
MPQLYYRALPAKDITTPNHYVLDLHDAFDWVADITDATPDYKQSVEVTQEKLRDQMNIDTELVKIDDAKQMEPKYVLRRVESDSDAAEQVRTANETATAKSRDAALQSTRGALEPLTPPTGKTGG